MTQVNFINRKESSWNDFSVLLSGGKKALKLNGSAFLQSYRELCQDLNTAKANGYDPSLIERLNSLVLVGNQILYSKRSWSIKTPIDFITKTFPASLRAEWRTFAVSFLIFYGLGLFIGAICLRNPDMAVEILGSGTANGLERMYNPESEHYLIPRDVSSDADMFGYYILNNISIAFRTFAGGILAGLGSLIFLAINGVYLGAVFAHLINLGYQNTAFPFIIAHGSFELTAIVLSAQGGFILGFALFFKKGLSRQASMKIAGERALPIIAGAALMLLIAAAIEAFWSSRHELPISLRYGVGAALWILVAVYFLFAGRKPIKPE